MSTHPVDNILLTSVDDTNPAILEPNAGAIQDVPCTGSRVHDIQLGQHTCSHNIPLAPNGSHTGCNTLSIQVAGRMVTDGCSSAIHPRLSSMVLNPVTASILHASCEP